MAAVEITGYDRVYFKVMGFSSLYHTIDFVATVDATTISILNYGHVPFLPQPKPNSVSEEQWYGGIWYMSTELAFDDFILVDCDNSTPGPGPGPGPSPTPSPGPGPGPSPTPSGECPLKGKAKVSKKYIKRGRTLSYAVTLSNPSKHPTNDCLGLTINLPENVTLVHATGMRANKHMKSGVTPSVEGSTVNWSNFGIKARKRRRFIVKVLVDKSTDPAVDRLPFSANLFQACESDEKCEQTFAPVVVKVLK
jgi:hypothetical protein